MASKKTDIPQHEIDALAKTFLSEIIAFFETEEGKKSSRNGNGGVINSKKMSRRIIKFYGSFK